MPFDYNHKTMGSHELTPEQVSRLKQLRAAMEVTMHFRIYNSKTCGAYVLNGEGTIPAVIAYLKDQAAHRPEGFYPTTDSSGAGQKMKEQVLNKVLRKKYGVQQKA